MSGSADEAARVVDSTGRAEMVDQVPADESPPATTPNSTSIVRNADSIATGSETPTNDVVAIPESEQAGTDLNGSAAQSTLNGTETSNDGDDGSSAPTVDRASQGVEGEPLRGSDDALSTGTDPNVTSARSSSPVPPQISPGDASKIASNSTANGTDGTDDEEDGVENELSSLNPTVATSEEPALPNADALSEPANVTSREVRTQVEGGTAAVQEENGVQEGETADVAESVDPLPDDVAGEAVASRSESTVFAVPESNASTAFDSNTTAISDDFEPATAPDDATVESLGDSLEGGNESRQVRTGILESLVESNDDGATTRVLDDNSTIWQTADESLGNAENVSNLAITSNETTSPSEDSADATTSPAPLRISGEIVDDDTTANLTDDIGTVGDVTASEPDVRNGTESVGDAVTIDGIGTDGRSLDGETLANATPVDPSVEDAENVTLPTLNDATEAAASQLDPVQSIAEDLTSDTTDLDEASPMNETRSLESVDIRLDTDEFVTTASETVETVETVETETGANPSNATATLTDAVPDATPVASVSEPIETGASELRQRADGVADSAIDGDSEPLQVTRDTVSTVEGDLNRLSSHGIETTSTVEVSTEATNEPVERTGSIVDDLAEQRQPTATSRIFEDGDVGDVTRVLEEEDAGELTELSDSSNSDLQDHVLRLEEVESIDGEGSITPRIDDTVSGVESASPLENATEVHLTELDAETELSAKTSDLPSADETNERVGSVWERADSVEQADSGRERLARRVDATSNELAVSTDTVLNGSTVLDDATIPNDATTAPSRAVDAIDDPATETTSQIRTSTDSVVIEPIDAAPSAVARATADGLATLDSPADVEDLGTLDSLDESDTFDDLDSPTSLDEFETFDTSDETGELANLETLDHLQPVRSAARPTERVQRRDVDPGTTTEIRDGSLPLDEEETRRTLQRAATRTAHQTEQSETVIDGDEVEPLTEDARATVSEIRSSTLDESSITSQTRDGVLGEQDGRIRTGNPLGESVDASAVADSLDKLSVEPTSEVIGPESSTARLMSVEDKSSHQSATDTVRTAVPITASEPIAEESTAGVQEIADLKEDGIAHPSRSSGRLLENRDAVDVSAENGTAVPTLEGTSVTFSDVTRETLVDATGDVEHGSDIGYAEWGDDVRAEPIQPDEPGERAGSDDSRSVVRLAQTDDWSVATTPAGGERVNRELPRAEIDPTDKWNGHDVPPDRFGELRSEQTEWATGRTESPNEGGDDEGRSSRDPDRLREFVASHHSAAGDSSRERSDQSPRPVVRRSGEGPLRIPDGGEIPPGYSSRIDGHERPEETIDRNVHPEAFVPGTGAVEDASRSDTGSDTENHRASRGEQPDSLPQIPSGVPPAPLVGLSAVILAGGIVRVLIQGGHLQAGIDPSVIRGSARTVGHASRGWLRRLDPRRIIPFPGYSRYDDSDPLENDNRATVYEVVNRSPGAHLAEVVDRTDIAPSTLRYHCRILEEEGLVETFAVDGRKRLFPIGVESKELVATLENDAAAEVLAAVKRLEPVNTSNLADALDRAPSTVSHHLARLENARLVARTREESSVLTRLTPETRATLEDQNAAGVEAE